MGSALEASEECVPSIATTFTTFQIKEKHIRQEISLLSWISGGQYNDQD